MRVMEEGVVLTDQRPRGFAAMMQRRIPPRFFIIDRELKVLSIGADPEIDLILPDALRVIARHGGELANALISMNEDTWLRLVPLEGTWADAFVVFIERFTPRGSLDVAAQRFRLTKREVEVLRLVLEHRSNSEIAQRLCIAESTVGDHVKNLFRKTGTARRTGLFAKLLQGED